MCEVSKHTNTHDTWLCYVTMCVCALPLRHARLYLTLAASGGITCSQAKRVGSGGVIISPSVNEI